MKEDVFIFKSNNVTGYVRPQELFRGEWEANMFFFSGKVWLKPLTFQENEFHFKIQPWWLGGRVCAKFK